VGDAIRTLLEHNIGAVSIIDDSGRLLGIFSERDVLMRVVGTGPDSANRPLGEVMTRNRNGPGGRHAGRWLLNKLDVGGYRHLPIVDQGRLQGMLSVRDMLRHLTKLCKGCG